MEPFENKEEALRYISEDPDGTMNTLASQFCPIIRDTCRRDCVAYVAARLTNVWMPNSIKGYKPHSAYCAYQEVFAGYYEGGC